MTKRKKGNARLFGFVLAMALIAAACGGGADDTATTGADGGGDAKELTPITLQLQWFTQAQFAGYYAAVDQGFYKDLGLDVTITQGGIDILPATVLDSGAADFAISWVPRGLVPREEGLNITNIAQIFERSATLQVSFKDKGITSVADLAGKTVGNWGFGNEFELLAGLRSAGLDPDTDVTLVQQQFDMLALISGEIDAAQAMIYNEYAQVLETTNPETGELFTADDLNVINWNDVGTAMLQDAIWADADKLESDPEYRANAVKFVEASMRGWIFCRDNVDKCVDIVLAAGPTLGESHQKWQMNEINGLIWPSSNGIGLLDKSLWDQTVSVATTESILTAPPTDGAFRTDIAQEALDNLKAAGVDVNGSGWTPITVELKPSGE
ncbi:MAG: ABC transporter substrate-binding protein [Actinobacteria bacterium]|nr:ABC transporter substrate-binding protein [Actinomycetota bacterium]